MSTVAQPNNDLMIRLDEIKHQIDDKNYRMAARLVDETAQIHGYSPNICGLGVLTHGMVAHETGSPEEARRAKQYYQMLAKDNVL